MKSFSTEGLNYLVKVLPLSIWLDWVLDLNRQDGRVNPVQPGADIVIPAGSDKMIFPIPTVELDAQR